MLWYPKPAEKWGEALPIGNGMMGAMVFGKTDVERIQFNEDSLWTGQPCDYQNPGAAEVLPQLRQLLFDGKQAEAQKLAMERFMSNPMRQAFYQPFGDLKLPSPVMKIPPTIVAVSTCGMPYPAFSIKSTA
jgi:alpha-L-fucosidase 2